MNFLNKKRNRIKNTEPSDVIKTTDDLSTKSAEPKTNSADDVKPVRPKEDIPYDGNGKYGIRSSMVNAGLDNDSIGYDGEYVTYQGTRVVKPDYEKNGTSYADDADINAAINNAYKVTGKEIAPITDLAGAYGVPEYAFKYNNGNVYLGGRNIPAVYESDGSSYAVSDDIRDAAEWYKKTTGIKNYGDIQEDYDKYRNKIDSLLDEYESRADWSYDIQSDPAYQSYVEAAMREGEKAYEDALGNMTARTGGYMNTAAVTAANQGLNYYMSQIQDKIPEFMEQSYDRYRDDLENDRQYIGMINDAAAQNLSSDLSVTDLAYGRQRQNGIDEYGRKNAAGEQYRNSYYTDMYKNMLDLEMAQDINNVTGGYIDNMLNAAELPYADSIAGEEYEQARQQTLAAQKENEMADVKIQGERIQNSTAYAEQIYKNAVIRGYFTPEEAGFLNLNESTDPISAYRTFLMLGKE